MTSRTARSHPRWPGRRRLAAALTALALAPLAGCFNQEPRFDPTDDRPCDFFDSEELEQHGFELGEDEDDRCHFRERPGWRTSLEYTTVQYVPEGAASVAERLGVPPIPAEETAETTVRFKGSFDHGDRRGSCVMVAPIDEDTSLVVEFGTNLRNVTWYRDPIEDPCEYLTHRYEEVETRLR